MNSSFQNQTTEDNTGFLERFFCFQNIFETALRYWKLVVICAVLGVVGGYVFTKYISIPRYSSQATFYVKWENEKNETQTPQQTRPSDEIINTSRGLALGMMLMKDYNKLLTGSRVADETKRLVAKEFSGMTPRERNYIIKVESARDTRIIELNGVAANPKVAQYAVQMTLDVFKGIISEDLDFRNVIVISQPSFSAKAINISLKRNLPIGLLLGLLVGGGIALLLGLLDQTIKDPEKAGIYLQRPVAGTIPLMDKEDVKYIFKLLESGENQELSETFRLLRANLPYIAVPDGNGGRVFMITSTVAKEGKSNCMATLAMLMGKAGKRVLLVDADLRRPSQHRIFDIQQEFGLANVLVGEKDYHEVITKVPEQPMLDIIPCGPIPLTPSELLMSDNLAGFIRNARDEYDYVFIDAPPALFLADPMIIMPLCDAVLFVVSCSTAKIAMIRKTLRQLSQIAPLPQALIVNRFNRESIGYKYSYGYYGYKRYRRYYQDYYTEPTAAGGKSRKSKK